MVKKLLIIAGLLVASSTAAFAIVKVHKLQQEKRNLQVENKQKTEKISQLSSKYRGELTKNKELEKVIDSKSSKMLLFQNKLDSRDKTIKQLEKELRSKNDNSQMYILKKDTPQKEEKTKSPPSKTEEKPVKEEPEPSKPTTVKESEPPSPPKSQETGFNLTFNVTKYTAGYESTQKKAGEEGYGVMANGQQVHEGVIACPAEYSFGTQIELEGLGTYTCSDRGGAITGNHLDIYTPSLENAQAFGRRNIKGRIVK